MTGVLHAFDPREGGAFSISLVYPDDDRSAQGKTTDRTDTFGGRIVELIPNEQVVWAVVFESTDPSFAGEMIVKWVPAPTATGTTVTLVCENIPRGIRAEDNEAGSRSTLDKLAAFLGG